MILLHTSHTHKLTRHQRNELIQLYLPNKGLGVVVVFYIYRLHVEHPSVCTNELLCGGAEGSQ